MGGTEQNPFIQMAQTWPSAERSQRTVRQRAKLVPERACKLLIGSNVIPRSHLPSTSCIKVICFDIDILVPGQLKSPIVTISIQFHLSWMFFSKLKPLNSLKKKKSLESLILPFLSLSLFCFFFIPRLSSCCPLVCGPLCTLKVV